MWDGKCNVIQYTGTNGQDAKHGLQRNFGIMKKTRAKNGYVCSFHIQITCFSIFRDRKKAFYIQ
jgi:hypothetical protein